MILAALIFAFLAVAYAVWANDEANDYRYRVERFAGYCAVSVAFAALAAMQVIHSGGR